MSKKHPSKFSKSEQELLQNFKKQTADLEMAQVIDLSVNCNNRYQFAKTHSVYIKDWEKTRQIMLDRAKSGNAHPDARPEIVKEMVKIGDKIIEEKLERVRKEFLHKFGKSIYNYIGTSGKTKGCFGVLVFFIIIGISIFILAI